MALYVLDATAAMFGQSRPLGIFWRLGISPDPLRFWMGFGDYPVRDEGAFDGGFPSIDVVGDIYYGLGQLLSLPELEVLINGLADRVEFALSGVSDLVVAQLAEAAPDVIGAPVNVGLCPLDSRWKPLTPIVSVWAGTADFWSDSQAPVRGLANPTNIIALSCYSGGPGRARPRRTSWTDPQHQRVNPGDKFFDRVPVYHRGFILAWPRF